MTSALLPRKDGAASAGGQGKFARGSHFFFFLAALFQHNLARGSLSCFFFFLTLGCPHFKFPHHMQDIYLAENFLANVIIK